MKSGLGCLLCEHFKPIVPSDWKRKYEYERYDAYNVRNAIREKELHQRGLCCLNPHHVEVTTNHVCAQIKLADYAIRDLSEFIWGSWREKGHDDAVKKAETMSSQLKAAREISRNRLRRLQKLGKVRQQQKPVLTVVKNGNDAA